CVTCLPATEEQDCGTKSCDPVAHECTSTERDSVGNCEKCKADSECHENFRCVPMNYMDVERGGYCLKDAAVSGCSQPFSVGITATSLSGEPEAQYCGIKQSLTTCEAVLARVNACPGDNPNECAPEGADCKTIELVQHKCTYPCDTSLQCETGMTCGSGYCGGPVI
ncbi:MAG: hypothetical protein KC417_13800, partial [Myxococcales bacterium]|nr:hypothetical protein [Myxococcales bacterium]